MAEKKKKLLITGPSGAVGRALVSLAAERGWEVTVFLHPGSARNDGLEKLPGLRVIRAELSDYAGLNVDTTGPQDAVVHLAWAGTTGEARNDAGLQLKNVEYTLDAVRMAKRIGAKCFLGAGSQAEYGITDQVLTPSLKVNPVTGYGIAKYTAGKLGTMLAEKLDIRFNWIRILSVYGPDDRPDSLISYVIKTLAEGKRPELSPCTQIWDYLYSRDAAAAFLACADRGKPGKTYVIGSGERRTLRDYVEEIRNLTAPDMDLTYGERAFYPGQPMFLSADISEIRSDTGWEPETSFREGILQVQKKLAKIQ